MATLATKKHSQDGAEIPFSVFAPTAILTPQSLRARELERAGRKAAPGDCPAMRELRMFLCRQAQNRMR